MRLSFSTPRTLSALSVEPARTDQPAIAWWNQPQSKGKDRGNEFSVTSTAIAPWYIVPTDDQKNVRLMVSQIVLDAFHEFKTSHPKMTA